MGKGWGVVVYVGGREMGVWGGGGWDVREGWFYFGGGWVGVF